MKGIGGLLAKHRNAGFHLVITPMVLRNTRLELRSRREYDEFARFVFAISYSLEGFSVPNYILFNCMQIWFSHQSPATLWI